MAPVNLQVEVCKSVILKLRTTYSWPKHQHECSKESQNAVFQDLGQLWWVPFSSPISSLTVAREVWQLHEYRNKCKNWESGQVGCQSTKLDPSEPWILSSKCRSQTRPGPINALPLTELDLETPCSGAAIVEFLALLVQLLKTSPFVCAVTPQPFSISHSEPQALQPVSRALAQQPEVKRSSISLTGFLASQYQSWVSCSRSSPGTLEAGSGECGPSILLLRLHSIPLSSHL